MYVMLPELDAALYIGHTLVLAIPVQITTGVLLCSSLAAVRLFHLSRLPPSFRLLLPHRLVPYRLSRIASPSNHAKRGAQPVTKLVSAHICHDHLWYPGP